MRKLNGAARPPLLLSQPQATLPLTAIIFTSPPYLPNPERVRSLTFRGSDFPGHSSRLNVLGETKQRLKFGWLSVTRHLMAPSLQHFLKLRVMPLSRSHATQALTALSLSVLWSPQTRMASMAHALMDPMRPATPLISRSPPMAPSPSLPLPIGTKLTCRAECQSNTRSDRGLHQWHGRLGRHCS